MRKSMLLLLVAFAYLAATCSKSASTNNTQLEGKWRQFQYLISPGPMGTWQPYNGEAFYLQFHSDGRLEATRQFLVKEYDRYSVIDHRKMWLYNSSTSDSLQLSYELTAGKLTIWQQCIEPCGIRLKRATK